MPRFVRVLLIVLAVFLAFLSGVYLGGHSYRLSPLFEIMPQSVRSAFFPGDNVLQAEREIENILEEKFYRPVDPSTLENGAVNGMVSSLGDPYSAYFSPDDYKQFMEHTEGTFVGVGVIIEPRDSVLTVVSPIDNSPAKKAGIQAGDEIIAVDGQSIQGKTPEEATALIRGEAGTSVTLRISRAGQEQDYTMVRESIELPIVSDKMIDHNGKKIGYVRLEQFSVDAGAKVKDSMDKLVNNGAQGIILDLRNNGGGLLDEAVNVASVFIQNGTIVTVQSRDQATQTYEARGDANESIPLVVLVNGYTASASEIVAGAIKDDHRGKLIGEKTFGKGVVQNIDPLSNGGALKFTSGSYHTPAGTDINKVGIEPDIPVTVDPNSPSDQVLDRGLAELAH